MIKLLVKLFIKNSDDVENPKVRESYSVLGGVLGVICNIILFGVKLAIGTVMGSIAIVSDAFNNLSDIGSSLVSIIGARMSNKKPDKEHPFGHGRFEYISSLIVSFIIILVGFELMRSSAVKIFHPEEVTFSLPLTITLCLSVLVKVWMYFYNRYLGKRINSTILAAASRDSLNDVISTSAVIAVTIAGRFINFAPLDGIVGTVVSVLIIISGYQIAKDTIGQLLGAAPDPALIKEIKDRILGGEGIVGIHDLIIHDYGPGRMFASVHAEVPDDYDIVKVHEIIDALEHEIAEDLGIETVIHMDPITVNSERCDYCKNVVIGVVKEIDSRMNIHDFRMTDGDNNINLIFDVEVPVEYSEKGELKNRITEEIKKRDARFNAVINIDTIYV